MMAAIFAGLTVILGAVYMLRSYQVIMLGETNKLTAGFAALTGNEKAVLFIVCAAVVGFGVYPKPLLDIMQNDVNNLATMITSAVKP